jgi:hypothetical protein
MERGREKRRRSGVTLGGISRRNRGEKGKEEGAWRCTTPCDGRRKWGPVLRALERGEGLGAGNGRSQRRWEAVREIGEGARWWGSCVAHARGPAQEEGRKGSRPREKERKWTQPRMNNANFDLNQNFQTDLNLIQLKAGLPVLQKIQNKIWICKKLNKEQLSLLEIFKILI